MTGVSGTEGSVRRGSTGERLPFSQEGEGGEVPQTELHRGLIEWGLSSEFQLVQLFHLHLRLEHL